MRHIYGWSISARPLDLIEAALLSADFDYRYVAKTWLFSRGREVEVSTMFMVEAVEPGRPLRQYETMIRAEAGWLPDLGPVPALFGVDFGYKATYATFEEAVSGHTAHVDTLRRMGFQVGLGSSVSRSVSA